MAQSAGGMAAALRSRPRFTPPAVLTSVSAFLNGIDANQYLTVGSNNCEPTAVQLTRSQQFSRRRHYGAALAADAIGGCSCPDCRQHQFSRVDSRLIGKPSRSRSAKHWVCESEPSGTTCVNTPTNADDNPLELSANQRGKCTRNWSIRTSLYSPAGTTTSSPISSMTSSWRCFPTARSLTDRVFTKAKADVQFTVHKRLFHCTASAKSAVSMQPACHTTLAGDRSRVDMSRSECRSAGRCRPGRSGAAAMWNDAPSASNASKAELHALRLPAQLGIVVRGHYPSASATTCQPRQAELASAPPLTTICGSPGSRLHKSSYTSAMR